MNQNPQVAQDQLDAFLRLINQPPTLPAGEAVDELIADAGPRRIQRAGVTRRRPQGQSKKRRKMAQESRRRNRA